MVDNRGINPVTSYFKSGDASGMANKMSEEKQGQGGEYFASEVQEDEQKHSDKYFQDRSAQLRASLNGLAVQNAGSIEFMKKIKEKESKKTKSKKKTQDINKEESYS